MWFKPSLARCVSVLLPVVVLAGCSAPPAPASFGSSWKKVNAFTVGVERIPFSETRNYVQRVMENLQVYRERLNQRTAYLIDYDLKRGGKRD